MSHGIYISSHSKERALMLKQKVEALGHEVVSTWHDSDACKRTRDREQADLQRGSVRNIAEIAEEATALIADYGPYEGGGVNVEVGAALAAGAGVVLLNGLRSDGTRRNNLLYHPLAFEATDDTIDAALAKIDEEDEFDDLDDDEDDFETEDFDDEDDDLDDEDDD